MFLLYKKSLPLSIILSPSFFSIIHSSSQVVFIEAPDASASLLHWSLAHACFRLGSLCSSFAFSFVLHLLLLHHLFPVELFVYPSFSDIGQLLGLCTFPCFLTVCVNMSVVFPVSASIRNTDLFPSTPSILPSWRAGTFDPVCLFLSFN